jgi:hypothetical protein
MKPAPAPIAAASAAATREFVMMPDERSASVSHSGVSSDSCAGIVYCDRIQQLARGVGDLSRAWKAAIAMAAVALTLRTNWRRRGSSSVAGLALPIAAST